jgi:SWI/SNF-related matrix-associated actin-dependent regulator 1 of chromatin subfamily A
MPSNRTSTLDNWVREFKRFAPSITIAKYHGSREKRHSQRQSIRQCQASTSRTGVGWEVLITTYSVAQGESFDKQFLRSVQWNVRTMFSCQVNLTLSLFA